MSALAFLLASSCVGSDLIGFMCGNVFQSHTCEIPPHLLAISSGHNTQQREESPQCLDSLDCSSAFIAAEENGSLQRFSTASAALSPFCHFPPLFSISFVFHSVIQSFSSLTISSSKLSFLSLNVTSFQSCCSSCLLRCSLSFFAGCYSPFI